MDEGGRLGFFFSIVKNLAGKIFVLHACNDKGREFSRGVIRRFWLNRCDGSCDPQRRKIFLF